MDIEVGWGAMDRIAERSPRFGVGLRGFELEIWPRRISALGICSRELPGKDQTARSDAERLQEGATIHRRSWCYEPRLVCHGSLLCEWKWDFDRFYENLRDSIQPFGWCQLLAQVRRSAAPATTEQPAGNALAFEAG
jgi:hypothetical protein